MSSLSYSSRLWQGFSVISNNFNMRNREFTQLNYLISEYSALEYDFSKGLSRLVSLPFKYGSNSTLGHSISSFLNLLRQESEIHSLNRKTIINSVQAQIEELLGKQQGRAQINKEKYHRNEISFCNILSELEEAKSSFHNAVQAAEKAKLTEYEISIKVLSNEQKKKIHQLREESMAKAQDAHDFYITKLHKANESREGYIEVSKAIYNEYQLIDQELIDQMKICLISLATTIIESSRKILKCYNESIEEFNKIDSIKDINNFIVKNQTKGYKPFKLEFLPYSFSNDTIQSKSASFTQKEWNIIENIRIDIRNMFIYKEEKYENANSNNKQKIESLTHLAFEGIIQEQDKTLLIELFKDKKNQQIFLAYLNLLRTQGLYLINESGYKTLVDLFNAIVETFTNDSVIDYDILQYCLIISQTYFTEPKDYENKRIYLLNNIIKHPFWKRDTLWTNLIREAILTQVNNRNDYMDYTKGITEEKEEAFNRMAFSNIMTYSDTLLVNGFQMEFIKKVITPLCELYSISEELIFESIEIRKDSNNGEAKSDIYDLNAIQKEISPKDFMMPQEYINIFEEIEEKNKIHNNHNSIPLQKDIEDKTEIEVDKEVVLQEDKINEDNNQSS